MADFSGGVCVRVQCMCVGGRNKAYSMLVCDKIEICLLITVRFRAATHFPLHTKLNEPKPTRFLIVFNLWISHILFGFAKLSLILVVLICLFAMHYNVMARG